MENNKIFKKNYTKVEIEKIKETGGSLLGFFKKSKKEVVDVVLYKSEAIFALSDNSLIIYDILRECQVLDIMELNKNDYQVIQLEIIYRVEDGFPFDLLICLCSNNLLFVNFQKYEIILNLELNSTAQKCYIEYMVKDKSYKIAIVHKYSICVYNLGSSNSTTNKLKLSKICEINSLEIITNVNILYVNNLLMFETRNKLNIFRIDYDNFSLKSYVVNKKDLSLYKNDILSDSLSKNTEVNKDVQFNFSKITNMIYLTIINKIFLIKNIYSELFFEEFEIIEKFTKQNPITMTKIVDPYIFIIIDSKMYIHYLLDLNKCIEMIELESAPTSNILYYKDINFLLRLNKLNFELNLIQYNDLIHLNKLKFLSQNEFEFILNSCQFLFMFYNSKSLKLEYIYSANIENQSRFLKGINVNFSSKLLSYLSQENLKLPEGELKKINEKYFLKKHLESLLSMISSQEYAKSKVCLEETGIDYIYLIILLKKFLTGRNLIMLVYYVYRHIVGKFYECSSESLSEKTFYLNKDLEEINSLISLATLKNEKELSIFLKTFFNRFITYRNEIKVQLDKEKMKKINFDQVGDILTEVENLNKEEEINIQDEFTFVNRNYNLINKKLKENNICETELRYCIIENMVFLFHFYSFRLSKNSKYTDNLKLMIKISHNLLDKDLINMLKQFNLEEEILLFYYYRGNYLKCISNIVSIYESLCKVKEDEFTNLNSSVSVSHYEEDFNMTMNMSSTFKEESSNNISVIENEENINNCSNILSGYSSFEGMRSLEKIKNQWLNRYINLISIISEKLSQMEFYEYIKWALSKNPFKTIEILFETNKISKEKLDLEFINLLKLFGIDPVIFYLKKFLKNNESCNTLHHNEMINLYTIKLKLLQEALDKEQANSKNVENSASSLGFYKWNKKILKTREEFCNFLIDQKLYNLDFAVEKIQINFYLQMELGIVLLKQNKIEEGIYKIFFSEFPPKMKIMKKLIHSMPVFEIVYLTLKYILTNYNKSPEKLNRILYNNENLPVEVIIVDLLECVKTEYSLIYKLAGLEIFNDLNSEIFLNFFVRIFSNLDGNSKSLKIETSLVDAKYMTSYNNLLELQKGKIVIDNKSSCFHCNKGFFNSQVVYLYPKYVYHIECYNEAVDNNQN